MLSLHICMLMCHLLAWCLRKLEKGVRAYDLESQNLVNHHVSAENHPWVPA